MIEDGVCSMSDLPPSSCGHCKSDPSFSAVRDTAGVAEGEGIPEFIEGFAAKFTSGNCTACGLRVYKGQTILPASEGKAFGYRHLECPHG